MTDRLRAARRYMSLAVAALTINACGGGPTAPPPAATATTLTLAMSPATTAAGGSSQGTFTIAPAPAAASTIALSSSNPQAAPVPSSVAVNSGQPNATFSVTAGGVSTATTVTITATLSTVTPPATATLTINPASQPIQPTPTVSSLSLTPNPVIGGNDVQGLVTLSGPAPSGGTVVTVSASDPSAVLARLPSSVTVPAGATSIGFTFGTRDVGGSFRIEITATAGGAGSTVMLDVQPKPLAPFVVVDGQGRLSTGFDIFVNTDLNQTTWLASIPGEGFRAAYPAGQQFGFIAIVSSGQTAPGGRPGRDLSAYKSLVVQLRGGSGGELVEIGVKDNTNEDNGSEVKKATTVTADWRTYSFSLADFNRSDPTRIYAAIELVFSGTNGRTVYFRDVRYVP